MKLFKRLLLVFTPSLAISMVAISPSNAATFGSSRGVFEFEEFSQSPSATFTSVEGNTSTISISGGTVFADVNAAANFLVAPAEASNVSSAIALGDTGDYLGLAESEATVVGSFDVKENTPFYFEFDGNLQLETSIDNPSSEKVRAAGDIAFALVDTKDNTLVDAFSLVSNITTPGDGDDYDFIAYQASDHIFLDNPTTIYEFGGNQENARADIAGYYQRTFKDDRNLALIEVKRNRVRVSAPEPSATLALLICCGIVGVSLKAKRQRCKLEGDV